MSGDCGKYFPDVLNRMLANNLFRFLNMAIEAFDIFQRTSFPFTSDIIFTCLRTMSNEKLTFPLTIRMLLVLRYIRYRFE